MSTLKILVVEDDQLSREMIRLFLERRGHNVDDAENGKQALQLFRSNIYDLIFMDIILPDFNGLHVAHVMHKIERSCFPYRQATTICALTSMNRDEISELSRSDDIKAFIHKPNCAEGLVAALALDVQQATHPS